MKHGSTTHRTQRYRGTNLSDSAQTLLLEDSHQGRMPAVTQHILEMRLNGRGRRDRARVLPISPITAIDAFKKSASDATHQCSGTPPDGTT